MTFWNIQYKTYNVKLLAWHKFPKFKDIISKAININQI